MVEGSVLNTAADSRESVAVNRLSRTLSPGSSDLQGFVEV